MYRFLWHLSARSYYADFVTVPIFGIAALLYALHSSGLTLALIVGGMLGALFMSFVEYSVHRWLFHRYFRREHWQHHTVPSAYIGVPGYQTAAYFALAYFLLSWLGSFGVGFFVGIVAAYMTYIISHDRYHHGDPQSWHGYWSRQARRHMVHHTGNKETNFGVSSPLWDHILGTYTS